MSNADVCLVDLPFCELVMEFFAARSGAHDQTSPYANEAAQRVRMFAFVLVLIRIHCQTHTCTVTFTFLPLSSALKHTRGLKPM